MEETKKDITCKIRKSLENKISEIYFFGSFFSDSWNPENSDVDLICVDSSFEEFPYFEKDHDKPSKEFLLLDNELLILLLFLL